MPTRIKDIQIYQCENCDETGSYEDIKKHEEEVCYANLTECDYNQKYDTKNLNRHYQMYNHKHKDFREIQTCNVTFERKQKYMEEFKGKLKCGKGHDIILLKADSNNDDQYYADLKFICVSDCGAIPIDLDKVVISTQYTNSFNLLQTSIAGEMNQSMYKKKDDK